MSPINKIISLIILIIGLSGAGFLYFKFFKPEPPKIEKTEEKKKGKIKRKIKNNKDGSQEISEIETYDSEKKSDSVSLQKDYILGLSIGYDFDFKKHEYNLIFGRRILLDLYAIGKINSNLNRIEGGVIWIF